MKLSTANLSQKLQNIKPIKALSTRLKQTAGKSGVQKRSIRRSESETVAGKKATDKGATERKVTDGKAIGRKAIGGKAASEKAASEKTASEKTLEATTKLSEELDQSKSGAPRSHSSNKSALLNTRAMPSFVRRSKLVQNSKSARVACHLLLVKPWVLVVALWLVSALSAVVAIEGLVSPKKLTEDLPSAVEVAPVAKLDSFIDVEQSDEGIIAEGVDDSENESGASASDISEAASDSRLPVWPIATLVGSCAAGCIVMSRRRAMLRMAARRKLLPARAKHSPSRLNASSGKIARRAGGQNDKKASIAAFKSAARSERLAANTARDRKRRQRKRLIAPPLTHSSANSPSANSPSANKKRVLVSRSTAQQAAPQSRVSQPVRPQRTRQKVARLVRRQPVVSVVPANQSHRLDWVEGSLAHDMDRRVAMREAASSQERAAM